MRKVFLALSAMAALASASPGYAADTECKFSISAAKAQVQGVGREMQKLNEAGVAVAKALPWPEALPAGITDWYVVMDPAGTAAALFPADANGCVAFVARVTAKAWNETAAKVEGKSA